MEKQRWWLWISAIVIALLTIGTIHFAYVAESHVFELSQAVRNSIHGLLALVFLFGFYTVYQKFHVHHISRQLREREEIFRVITQNPEELIDVVNREGTRLYSSPTYTDVFGYSEVELRETSFANHVHHDDRAKVLNYRLEMIEKAAGPGPPVEFRFQRKDGTWRMMESRGTPVRNRRGEIEKLVIVSRDVTDRQKAEGLLLQREEQLRQAQKMEAVGRLSGGIAHDFNNLLGVIIGYSESLELRLSSDDPLRKNAEEIRKAGERAAALTHQLLAFSRQQVLQPKVLDLNAVVTDMGKMLRRLIGVDIELSTVLASHLGRVKTDQSQLEQVIVNLVVNARDAMPSGGKLLVETSNIYIDDKLARSLPFLRSGPHILLAVTDTGTGIDEDTQRHIFEPFFTTKGPGKGTGLGLATVYGVVKQSGGVVGIDSKVGRGSTFKIFLPQAEELATPSDGDVSGNISTTGTATILLVEDEAALLNLTADVLRQNGYTVLPAHDGIEALEVAASRKEAIHLLLTDISMPKLGGPALAQNIIQLRPGIRILFMTGNAERDSISNGLLPDGAEFLQKPFTQQSLMQQVRRTLNAASMQFQN